LKNKEDPSLLSIDLMVLKAAILGDSFPRIVRKTKLPEKMVRSSIERLVKSKRLEKNKGSRYYFMTEKGEKLLSDSNVF
jgi:predicted transcriptional regulator